MKSPSGAATRLVRIFFRIVGCFFLLMATMLVLLTVGEWRRGTPWGDAGIVITFTALTLLAGLGAIGASWRIRDHAS